MKKIEISAYIKSYENLTGHNLLLQIRDANDNLIVKIQETQKSLFPLIKIDKNSTLLIIEIPSIYIYIGDYYSKRQCLVSDDFETNIKFFRK